MADNEPVFNEPWEAQAFALVVAMHDEGLFKWSEWAEMLGKIIAADQNNLSYYELWLGALERMIEEKSVLQSSEVEKRKSAWADAVARTPHGKPIELGQDI